MGPLLITINAKVDPVQFLCYRDILWCKITNGKIIDLSSVSLNGQLTGTDKGMILCRIREIKKCHLSVFKFQSHTISWAYKGFSIKSHSLTAISLCHRKMISFSVHGTFLSLCAKHPADHADSVIAMQCRNINVFHISDQLHVCNGFMPGCIQRLQKILLSNLDFRLIFLIGTPQLLQILLTFSGRCFCKYRNTFFKQFKQIICYAATLDCQDNKLRCILHQRINCIYYFDAKFFTKLSAFFLISYQNSCQIKFFRNSFCNTDIKFGTPSGTNYRIFYFSHFMSTPLFV